MTSNFYMAAKATHMYMPTTGILTVGGETWPAAKGVARYLPNGEATTAASRIATMF